MSKTSRCRRKLFDDPDTMPKWQPTLKSFERGAWGVERRMENAGRSTGARAVAWKHILEEHGELAQMQQQILDTVAKPDRILAGSAGELLSICQTEPGKWLVVVYREKDDDVIIRYDGDEIIGFTVLHASQR